MPETIKPVVYIVGDDESVRRAMQKASSIAGFDVQPFVAGQEFLDSGYQEQNSCLVLDIQLPGLNGLDLQQKLLDRGSTIPVIFITAFDSEETRQEARNLGAAGYFQKPIDARALLDSIQWALSKSVQ